MVLRALVLERMTMSNFCVNWAHVAQFWFVAKMVYWYGLVPVSFVFWLMVYDDWFDIPPSRFRTALIMIAVVWELPVAVAYGLVFLFKFLFTC